MSASLVDGTPAPMIAQPVNPPIKSAKLITESSTRLVTQIEPEKETKTVETSSIAIEAKPQMRSIGVQTDETALPKILKARSSRYKSYDELNAPKPGCFRACVINPIKNLTAYVFSKGMRKKVAKDVTASLLTGLVLTLLSMSSLYTYNTFYGNTTQD